MSSTCARSGGAALCAANRLITEGRNCILRQALVVAQIELQLIAQNVLPPRAHFLARLEYHATARGAR